MNYDTTPNPTKQRRPFLTVFCCSIIAVLAWHALAPRFSNGDTLAQARAAQIQNEALSSGYNAQLTASELFIRYRPGQVDTTIGLAVFAEQYRLAYKCEPQVLGYRLCTVGLQ